MRRKCGALGCAVLLFWFARTEAIAGEVVQGNPLGGDARDLLEEGSALAGAGDVGGIVLEPRKDGIDLMFVVPMGPSKNFRELRTAVLNKVSTLLAGRWSGASVDLLYEKGSEGGRQFAFELRDLLRDKTGGKCGTLDCAGVVKRIRAAEEIAPAGQEGRGAWVRVRVAWR